LKNMKISLMSKISPDWPRCLYRLLLPGMMVLSGLTPARAQIAAFNFSATAAPVTGWTNLAGNASDSVIAKTSGGLTLSSVSASYWAPLGGTCGENGEGNYPGTYFPIGVMSSGWFQYNGSAQNLALYNALMPQFELTGLNPDSTYILRMSGSNGSGYNDNPTVYTVAGTSVYASQNLNAGGNTSHGVTFTAISPDATGMIRIYVNCTSSTALAAISGIQIFPGSAQVGTPIVAITAPTNGTIISEGGNLAIQATASEPGQTITKVEFYADTTKIGEVDTAPYNFTWVGPDPGPYQLTAKATDNVGTINTASISVDVTSLNYYWSTTGNIGNNGDSNFVGNVDSVRLGFRTKDIERLTILATGNVGIGTITPTAQFHTTGSVRLAGLHNDSTGADPRIVVSDTSGNLSYRSAGSAIGLTIGDGLGETASGALTIGDTIPGYGPHSFTANRYQYLNGYMYSIGGSVNNPVTNPNFRIYDNGDLTAGTTMDRSVNTVGQTGLRYYSKLGMLQIGASDWLDTTVSPIVYGTWPSSGLIINTETPNVIKARFLNTVFAGGGNTLDTAIRFENNVMAMTGSTFTTPTTYVIRSVMAGLANNISASIESSVITGKNLTISKPITVISITGLGNTTLDSARCSLIGGDNNQFGGLSQLVSGQYLVNRTPYGTTLGNTNVDFASLNYTGLQGTMVAGISGYPLFALGNSSANDGSIHSNALTVLYNGRTQINTTGFSNALTQTNVTPKAALEVISTNTGVLLPKLNTTQRNAIVTADLQNGLLLYNTDSSVFQFYNGSAWNTVGAGVNSGAVLGWSSGGNTGTNPATNFIGTTDTERLVFRTDDIERMTILSSGAIGIGTSVMPASDAQLAVNGTVYTTKVHVTQSGWPDYVFDKGYSLPNLASVEKYIRLHRHLPGMISADEVRQQRLDLGDNQSALLKKIEELTLYLIEEHKKADDQQKEIERLREQNKRLDDQQKEIDQLKAMLEKVTSSK
jgi:hypothetical protein